MGSDKLIEEEAKNKVTEDSLCVFSTVETVGKIKRAKL